MALTLDVKRTAEILHLEDAKFEEAVKLNGGGTDAEGSYIPVANLIEAINTYRELGGTLPEGINWPA